MKNLTLIIHSGVQQLLADVLREMKEVKGFTFIHVEGHSESSDQDVFLSARDRVVGYVPRVRVDMLLEDDEAAKVIDALHTDGNFKGQGVYWVSPVEQMGRL